jgi:hypothetical protein
MRDAYEMAVYELAAYELAAYEMAYVRGMIMRCTPTMRDMSVRWPVRGTPMRWHVYERHAYGMVYGRYTYT